MLKFKFYLYLCLLINAYSQYYVIYHTLRKYDIFLKT